MKFRITSIAEEEASAAMRNVLPDLEDWLNTTLGDGDFGGSLDCLMMAVFATDFVPSSGKSVAPSRLSTCADARTGGKRQLLALHVSAEPVQITQTPPALLHRVISGKLIAGLPSKPLRVPKGLDYARVRASLIASLSARTSSYA